MNHVYAMYWGVPFCLYVLAIVNFRYFENECPGIRKLNFSFKQSKSSNQVDEFNSL